MGAGVHEMLARREVGRGASLRKHDVWARRYECSAVLAHHQGCVNSLSWSADGRTLLSGSDDRLVGVWSFASSWEGQLRAMLRTRHVGNIFDAQQCPFEPDLVLTSAADGRVGLTHLAGGEPSLLFEPSTHGVSSKLDFQPGASRVVLVPFKDGLVRLFDLRDPARTVMKHATKPPHPPSGANDVKFRPFSTAQFAVASDDVVLRVYDLRYPQHVRRALAGGGGWHPGADSPCAQPVGALLALGPSAPPLSFTAGVSGVCWSRSGQQLLVNYRDADLALLDVPADLGGRSTSVDGGAVVQPAESLLRLWPRQTFSGRDNVETCCKEACFLLDEQCVATGGDCGSLFIWRAQTGELVRRIVADRCIVNCVASHPTLPLLAVSGIDHEIKVIDVGAEPQHARTDEARERHAAHAEWPQRQRRERSVPAAAASQALRAAARLREEANGAFRDGQLDAAEARYRSAEEELHFVPPNASLATERRALLVAVWLNLSLCMLRLRRWGAVVGYCGLVLQKEPGSVKALYRRASALLEGAREYDEAERDVRAGLELEPTNAELLRLRQAIRLARAAERRAEGARFRNMFGGGGDE